VSPRIRCRLFVTDLDGTVLVDEGPRGARLPGRTMAALRRLSESGVTVCLASGRMHESIRSVSAGWGFKGPVISYNGAMIRLEDDSLFSHDPLGTEVSGPLIEMAESRGLPLNFYSEGRILSQRFHPWWDLYEGRTCSPMQEVTSLLPYRGSAATKLLIMSDPSRIKELEAEFKPRLSGAANVLITNDEYLEFMAPSVHKGMALARLAAHLGVDSADIVAAGDGTNDIEMLQGAGCAVAVSGARPALLRLAHHVVAGPAEHGVAEFIETHLLG
jgi:Cof subfamily protein (haloacid dehalogenase superfamily)